MSPTSRAPRVLLDGYFLGRPYGFGRYVRELAAAVDAELHGFEPVVVVPDTAEAEARALLGRTELVSLPRRSFPYWEQVVVPMLARRSGCDLVHFPYQSAAMAWPSSRSVTTIHDLMFLRPANSAAATVDWVAHSYRRALFELKTRRSNQLIAVSAATARELRSERGLEASVVHNTCDAFVREHRKIAPASDEGAFFLHRGGRGAHKNTRRIVEAFALARRALPELRLLVYGGDATRELLEGLPLDGVSLIGKVDDARLAALYKGSLAVIVASLEEGFGLSIIEAFGFGTTAIVSNVPPMSDVAGDAALCVDPTSVEQISAAISRLAGDQSLRRELLAAAPARCRSHSASAVATELAAVYRRALSSARRAPAVAPGLGDEARSVES